MGRLTDNDRRMGPLTYARSSWSPLRLVFSTGGDEEGDAFNNLTCYAFGWVARLRLPKMIAPYREWVATGHYAWAKSPDSGYWEVDRRDYGLSLHDGFLQVFYGRQSDCSTTDRTWCCHLPWTEWRFVRRSFYGLSGEHFWTEPTARQVLGGEAWDEMDRMRKTCPVAVFAFIDSDGKELTASTRIEERQWKFGTKWFKWLSLFRRDMVRRSLDIEFSAEVGPEKGSWKGGILGTGIEMLPGELHADAFRRFCEQEHSAKYGRYRLTFVGPATTTGA